MAKKVLVVDDSALMRRVLSDIINEDEQLTVADVAGNGEVALDFLKRGKPYDMVILDVYMPKMDGVSFLRELNKEKIAVPCLMISSIAGEQANETLEALALGAFDFVKKPKRAAGEDFNHFRDEILLRVYCACGLGDHRDSGTVPKEKDTIATRTKPVEPIAQKEKPAEPMIIKKPRVTSSVATVKGDKLFVIASSTGGPKALQSVIPLFPRNFQYPIVVVQHMPKGFTSSLAARLNDLSYLNVKEAEDGEVLQKGYVYIAPGGKQCELIQKKPGTYTLSVNDKPARGGLRPCADIFLESLVNTSFEEIICAVLTGMGSDASKGIQLIKGCKNVKVVAQDEASSVVYGMPRAVKELGIVNQVVPLRNVTTAMIKELGV